MVSTGKNSDTVSIPSDFYSLKLQASKLTPLYLQLNVERYIIKGSSTLPNSTLTEEQETIWLETKELFKHNGSRMTEVKN